MDYQARFENGFQSLLEEEGIADPNLLDSVEIFDEVPVYSRINHLTFLDDLDVAEKNRFLIWATVKVLDAARTRFSGESGEFLRLVTVTGWWIDGDSVGGRCAGDGSELLVPHLWVGNMAHPHMRGFRAYRPSSSCSEFVRQSITRREYDVLESDLLRGEYGCPTRVYVGHSADLAGHFAAYVATPSSSAPSRPRAGSGGNPLNPRGGDDLA